MRRWAECRTEQERRATFAEAEKLCQGQVSAVAAVLGVDRQHAYRLREKYGTAPAAPRAPGEAITITLELPRRCVEWLEVMALRRKHAGGAGKAAKSPIVVELIERIRTGQEAEPSAGVAEFTPRGA